MEKIEGNFYSMEYTLLGFSTVRGWFSFTVPKNKQIVTATTNLNYTGMYQPTITKQFTFTYNRNELSTGTGSQDIVMPSLKGVCLNKTQTIEFSPKLIKKDYMSGMYFSNTPHDTGTFNCTITDV